MSATCSASCGHATAPRRSSPRTSPDSWSQADFLPDFGQESCRNGCPPVRVDVVSEEIPDELLHHVVASTALPAPVARRVIADVLGYFDETVEEYVRRRHTELKRHR